MRIYIIDYFIPICDRVCLLHIYIAPLTTYVIRVYCHTCDGSEDGIEIFYDNIKKGLRLTTSPEVNTIMWDLNATVGKVRRKISYKNKNAIKYRELQKEIKFKIREAKEEWLMAMQANGTESAHRGFENT